MMSYFWPDPTHSLELLPPPAGWQLTLLIFGVIMAMVMCYYAPDY